MRIASYSVHVFPYIALLLLHAAALGQTREHPAPDEEWKRLNATMKIRLPTESVGNGAADGLRLAELAQHYRVTAAAAKDFYTRFPQDARAAKAKKLEVTAGLGAIGETPSPFDAAAISAAQNYRLDKSNSREDRFDAAVGVERVLLARRMKAWPPSKLTRGMEKIASGLEHEFGRIPKLYSLYIDIARRGDMVSADRIASLLVASNAQPEVAAEARTILERRKLIGSSLHHRLSPISGAAFNLADRAEVPTVISISSATRNPGAQGQANALMASHKDRLRWVHISVGGSEAAIKAQLQRTPVAGIHCAYSDASQSSLLEELRLSSLPFIVVLNSEGTVVGYGPPEELSALLSLNKQQSNRR